jgi:PIN domain nuclease of toxin-antitoxin system|tara:strand:+ start:303 stop:689 length:387 start_codon:yes stop_codon:yes gene_type:complete
VRLLLDTCTFLWLVTDDPNLSPEARSLIVDPDNEVLLSAVSTWEIAVKHGLGRLPLPDDPERYVPKLRRDHAVEPLPLDEESTLYLRRLPGLHRDPFDRMLVCQAIVQGVILLTPDRDITQYPVRTLW